MTSDPAWMAAAACRGLTPNLFHPEPGDSRVTLHAKQVCAECPVADACLQYALDNGMDDGVWGGKTPGERRPRNRRNIDIRVYPIREHGVSAGYGAHLRRREPPCEACRLAHNQRVNEYKKSQKRESGAA